jgi:hypothetical protein
MVIYGHGSMAKFSKEAIGKTDLRCSRIRRAEVASYLVCPISRRNPMIRASQHFLVQSNSRWFISHNFVSDKQRNKMVSATNEIKESSDDWGKGRNDAC